MPPIDARFSITISCHKKGTGIITKKLDLQNKCNPYIPESPTLSFM